MTKDDIEKELKRINESIPKLFKDTVTQETELTPVMAMVVDRAIENHLVSPEKKLQLQQLKDSGYFSRKKVVENKEVSKKIDEYVSREIKKSIKAGRLPNKKQLALILKENENKN